MSWPWTKQVESNDLSLRDKKILELLAANVKTHESMANCYEELFKMFKTMERRLERIETQVKPIKERQDTLIKLFMEYADRVLALTNGK
jgi:uncharacterized protein Yka (UPF0111/DUF47 family)